MSERSAAPGASAWKVALLDASRDGRAKDARVEVPRLVLDVVIADGARGLVTVSLREGALVAVDERGERSSSLTSAALEFLVSLGKEHTEHGAVRSDHPGPRVSLAPPGGARALDLARDPARLAALRTRNPTDAPCAVRAETSSRPLRCASSQESTRETNSSR